MEDPVADPVEDPVDDVLEVSLLESEVLVALEVLCAKLPTAKRQASQIPREATILAVGRRSGEVLGLGVVREVEGMLGEGYWI